MSSRRRVLIAKPGLDGHERGAKVIVRLLRDAGCEVIYTGIRQRPEAIAKIAVAEDVQVIGLSILSGSHLPLCRAVLDALAEERATDIPVVVGGTIPDADVPELKAIGVKAVFGVQSSLEEIREWFAQS